jgi:hypothetical protein
MKTRFTGIGEGVADEVRTSIDRAVCCRCRGAAGSLLARPDRSDPPVSLNF